MISDLQRAVTLLQTDHTSEALDALLLAWRSKRAPEIADAVDALAHAFPPSAEEWMLVARNGAAGDLYKLLATVVEAGPISALGGRVEMLVERPVDPRIALAFANLALDPPTTSSSNFPIWTKIFAAIELAGDARVVPILKKRLRMKPGASKFWPKLTAWIEKALKKIPPPPKLTKEEAAAVAAVVRAAKSAKPAAPVKAKPHAKPVAVGDPLGRALAAVENDDLPACVDALLDGWRERPLAAYAELIDRVTALHDEGVACPGGTDADLQRAWVALAAKKRAIDVGRLASSVGDGKVGDVDRRLEDMLAWPSDPRVSHSMFQQCVGRSFSDRVRTWNLVADLLVKNVDVRLAPELGGFAETRGDNKALRSAMRRAGPAALEAIAQAPKEPTRTERVALDAVSAALARWYAKRPVTERSLLEAIAAAPDDDDAPALVYADWLVERGHPRGELIVLQCSNAPDEGRIRDLVREHTRALLGPAAGLRYSVLAYGTGGGSFHRGLLRTIELRNRLPRWMFEGHPLLWFLEEIDPGYGASLDTALAVIEGSRRLRSLKASPRLAARLAARPVPLSVERLELSHAREAEAPFATLLDGIAGPGLSRVEHLELFWSNGVVHHEGIPDALVASPLFDRLETLSVATENLSSAIDALNRHGRTVPTLSFLRRDYLDYRLDVRLGPPTTISLHPVGTNVEITKESVGPLVAALKSLRLPAKTKLAVGKGVTLAAPARAALAKVVTL